MKTYLIQRAEFKNREEKKGIDSIISLDYMGSSEFEWGALPDSLKKIRSGYNDYVYLDVPIMDKVVTVFCKDFQKSEVKTYLTKLSKREMILKERIGFDLYINNGDDYLETDFWWDLDNDLMFWNKNPEFESKFKMVIINKPL